VSACHVCGRENLDEATHCAGCATALTPPLRLESPSPCPSPIPPASPALADVTDAAVGPRGTPVAPGPPTAPPLLPPPPPVPPVLPALPKEPTLNAKSATLILLSYLAVQIGIGFIGSIVLASFAALHGANLERPEVRNQVLSAKIGMIGVLSIPPAALIMFLMSRSHARSQLTTPTGAAWTVGEPRWLLQGLAVGILAGAGYLGVFLAVPRPVADAPMGPLASMAATPGFPQVIWLIGALLFAPVAEELLFRGVLYGGYRKSMGPAPAAALTTFIFWLLHINETIYFPPAMVSVAALALLALWFRLRAAAIGPAIALHLGYNGVVAAAALLGTLR